MSGPIRFDHLSAAGHADLRAATLEMASLADVYDARLRDGPAADPAPEAVTASEIGAATREGTIGCRLSFRWLGQSRAIYGANLRLAADAFNADPSALRLSKKLLDARHPAVRRLTSLRGQAREEWVRRTLPYVEPGMRLLRRDQIAGVAECFSNLEALIAASAMALEQHRPTLLREAEERLGTLFNATDYPHSFEGAFGVSLTFPAVEPPEYLMGLNPELYRREQERVRAAFEAAVAAAENEFTEELARLVGHLRERLTSGEDGRPHVFRDSAVSNIREFIQRVRDVSIETDGALASLLTETESLLDGVSPGALRQDETLRERMATELGGLEEQITVALPARRIRRLQESTEAAAETLINAGAATWPLAETEGTE